MRDFDSLYPVGKGIRATVIEAEEIGGGVTARTTGKVTAQHGFFCRRLTAGLGEGLARQYAAANRCGMERLMQLAENEAAGCDFERLDSYAYVRDPDNAALAREEAEAALLLGFEAEWVRETELPFSVAGAVCFHSQGMFHPLKFLNRLTAFLAKQGVRFYAHTRALPPEGGLGGTVPSEPIGASSGRGPSCCARIFPFWTSRGGISPVSGRSAPICWPSRTPRS